MSVIAQAGAKGRQLHKFGGSSLADVKCYLRVAGIMAEYSQPDDMMVVSAAGSTTNQLINYPLKKQIASLALLSAIWNAWRHCSTAVLTTRCMQKWWATVKCGRRA